MKLILLRHGETIANQEYETPRRVLIGALESPLTQLNEEGKRQALKAKEKLHDVPFDRIYCSDLTRARQTAEIVFPDTPLVFDPRLRERSLGIGEGRLYSEAIDDPELGLHLPNYGNESLQDSLTKKTQGGENYLDVLKRGKDFLNDLFQQPIGCAVIVSHYHFLRCFITLLQKEEPGFSLFRRHIPNSEPLFFIQRDDRMVEVEKKVFLEE